MAEPQDTRIITPMPSSLVARIEDYRFRERIPSRAEAIRRLVEKGLGGPHEPWSDGTQPAARPLGFKDLEP